jgi:hypothetical protein
VFDLGDRTTTVLRRPEKQVPYLVRSVGVSADGRTLVFSMIDHSDDEVLVVDLTSRSPF